MSKEAINIDEENIVKETFSIIEHMPSPKVVTATEASERQIEFFNSLLSNEFAIFTKTLNYHWNVTGPRFNSVHKFFGEQYKELINIVDSVAERIREMGGRAKGTLKEFSKSTSVIESPGKYPNTTKMIAELMTDHESLQIQIKAMIKDWEVKGNDPGSVDFLTTLLKKHEEMGWMLRSHLN